MGIVDDAQKHLGKLQDLLKDNPEAAGVILIALQRLQGLIKAAGLPDLPVAPVGADALREMAADAVNNLKASQSTLEKFIDASLKTTDHVISALEMLIETLTSE